MNKPSFFKLILLFVLMIAQISVYSQENLGDLIYKKDFENLKIQLDDEIDLCIMDDTQINTKEEVVSRVKAFLNKYSLSKIEALHNGKANQEKGKYKVYKLITNEGPFRVFVYYEIVAGQTIVKEMRFDKF